MGTTTAERSSNQPTGDQRPLTPLENELLAALKGFLLGCSSENSLADVVGEDVIRDAHAAIAKAERAS